MAHGHGGARPGSGRKRKESKVAQAGRREVVLAVFDEAALAGLMKKWLVLAEDTPSVIYPLLPYILGGVKQAEDRSADTTLTIRIEAVDRRDTRPDIRILDAV